MLKAPKLWSCVGFIMADKRKLQCDIDRVLKRVQEGRAAFQVQCLCLVWRAGCQRGIIELLNFSSLWLLYFLVLRLISQFFCLLPTLVRNVLYYFNVFCLSVGLSLFFIPCFSHFRKFLINSKVLIIRLRRRSSKLTSKKKLKGFRGFGTKLRRGIHPMTSRINALL